MLSPPLTLYFFISDTEDDRVDLLYQREASSSNSSEQNKARKTYGNVKSEVDEYDESSAEAAGTELEQEKPSFLFVRLK